MRYFRSLGRFLLAAGIASRLLASDIAGPVYGYAFDPPTQSLRRITGIPGAALLGEAVLSGLDYTAVAPDGKEAIIVRQGVASVVRGLDSSSPEVFTLSGTIDKPESCIWSGDAGKVLLYSSSRSEIQFLTRGAAGYEPESAMDISSLPGTVSSIILDRPGRRALVSTAGAPNSGLFLISSQQIGQLIGGPGNGLPVFARNRMSVQTIGASGRPIHITDPIAQLIGGADKIVAVFASDGESVYSIQTGGRLVHITALGDRPEYLTLASNPQELADADGLIASADGKGLYVLRKASKSIAVFDLTANQMAGQIPLDAEPGNIQPISASSYLLNVRRSADEPLLLLETTPNLKVSFIPAQD